MKKIARLFYALALRCGHVPDTTAPHWAHDCASCKKPRGRNDRYRILAWEHIDCEYPQGSPLPEALGSNIDLLPRGPQA